MENTPQDKGFFTPLANTNPYFKCAAQGMAGTGKTFTTALITIGLHKRIGSDKPVVYFDTEKSAKFLGPVYSKAGIEVLVKQSRTLPDLVATMKQCSDGVADILVIDSITHVYELFLSDYQRNKHHNKGFLEFQDWATLKPLWKREFSDRLVNSPIHILFTGREGFTYDQQVDENTGKREIVKSGVRMKAEGETAYEPDLLLRFERFEELLGNDKEIYRECTVVKDRSDQLDGKVFRDPSYEDFAPVVEFLLTNPAPDGDNETRPNDDLLAREEDNSEERREAKAQRERIDNMLDTVAAGTSGDAKTLRLALKEYAFYGETSDTAIHRMSLDQLNEAHDRLKPMCRAVWDAMQLERRAYPAPKAIEAARLKYIGSVNLGQTSLEALTAYQNHMKEKVSE